jgi:N-methylhydantoinase A/oxoprolinase/acetone carboxylase beta subunit
MKIYANAARIYRRKKLGSQNIASYLEGPGQFTYALAEKLGINKFFIHLEGVMSAGFGNSILIDLSEHVCRLKQINPLEVNKIYDEMENSGIQLFRSAGVRKRYYFSRSCDMRYISST